jgi:hypothetical protein
MRAPLCASHGGGVAGDIVRGHLTRMRGLHHSDGVLALDTHAGGTTAVAGSESASRRSVRTMRVLLCSCLSLGAVACSANGAVRRGFEGALGGPEAGTSNEPDARVGATPGVAMDAAPPPPDPGALHAGVAAAGLQIAGEAGAAACGGDMDASTLEAGPTDASGDGGLQLLTWGETATDSIAIDSLNVYWTTSDEVLGMPLAGGAPIVLANGQELPHGLAVDATSVYWANTDGSVMKAPVGGGAWALLATGSSYEVPVVGIRNLAVDSESVYWANPASGQVLKVSIDGGTVVTLSSGERSPGALAIDGTSVYYTTLSDGDVKVIPIAGGSPVTIASGQKMPAAIAVDSESVYWTNFSGSDVMKASLGGGNPQILASGKGIPRDLAVDARGVYWLQSFVNDDQVMYLPLGGGTPTVLSSTTPGNLNEVGIALGCRNVYVTASSLGSVDPGNPALDVPSVGGVLEIAR